MDFTKEYQTNISLCTGSKGLERGIERTGIKLRTLANVEIEAFVCENLVQQMEQGVVDEERQRYGVTGSSRIYYRDRWPARPNEKQYDWESPRIESNVGSRINGYNFREDLLRLLGNAVVEQTSELAWVTLWNKFLQ